MSKTDEQTAKSGTRDSRVSRRKSTRIPGQIIQRRVTAIACTIRDTSATGALVELWQGPQKAFTKGEFVGDQFTLVMTNDFLEVDCEVVWRKAGTIGVRYRSALRQRPKPVRREKPAKAEEPNTLLSRLLTPGVPLSPLSAKLVKR
ncbi:MAG: PilZ domain-containing protein [Hyphomicrobiaceae bacterium]|nr:MAG: PilZ domain-containing protein [Hyphomicrobiaceae bacterium]